MLLGSSIHFTGPMREGAEPGSATGHGADNEDYTQFFRARQANYKSRLSHESPRPKPPENSTEHFDYTMYYKTHYEKPPTTNNVAMDGPYENIQGLRLLIVAIVVLGVAYASLSPSTYVPERVRRAEVEATKRKQQG